MRLTFVMLLLFFMAFSVRSRELTSKEKLVLIPLKKTELVKSFMLDQIKVSDLPFRDFLSFQIYKKACAPLKLEVEKIDNASNELPDQSEKLLVLYQACGEGVMGLSSLYVKLQ